MAEKAFAELTFECDKDSSRVTFARWPSPLRYRTEWSRSLFVRRFCFGRRLCYCIRMISFGFMLFVCLKVNALWFIIVDFSRWCMKCSKNRVTNILVFFEISILDTLFKYKYMKIMCFYVFQMQIGKSKTLGVLMSSMPIKFIPKHVFLTLLPNWLILLIHTLFLYEITLKPIQIRLFLQNKPLIFIIIKYNHSNYY